MMQLEREIAEQEADWDQNTEKEKAVMAPDQSSSIALAQRPPPSIEPVAEATMELPSASPLHQMNRKNDSGIHVKEQIPNPGGSGT